MSDHESPSLIHTLLGLIAFTCLNYAYCYTIKLRDTCSKNNVKYEYYPIDEQETLHERVNKFSKRIETVLKYHSKDLRLSPEFIASLLRTKEEDDEVSKIDVTCIKDDSHNKNGENDRTIIDLHNDPYKCRTTLFDDIQMIQDANNVYFVTLKGIPQRPFYHTLSARIVLLTEFYLQNNMGKRREEFDICGTYLSSFTETNPGMGQLGGTTKKGITCYISEDIIRSAVVSTRVLVNATKFGLTENMPLPTFVPFNGINNDNDLTPENVVRYFNTINKRGILELLGLRTTVGSKCSENYLNYIPNLHTLIQAADQPCKPESNPPRLTVAGRARAKHAHRGTVDQYFGVCKGSTIEKNHDANKIVHNMINNALWINIHVFGGVVDPVLEIRTEEGYGARWSLGSKGASIIGKNNNTHGNTSAIKEKREVIFRGFLEPHMLDGFEKKWRH